MGQITILEDWSAGTVTEWYLRYHLVIEFFLFTAIFTAAVWAPLRHRFPGRPGKTISVCMGLILSLWLTLGMARYEVSLLSVPWLELMLLAFLGGLVLVVMIRRLSFGVPTAFAIIMMLCTLVVAQSWDARYPLSSIRVETVISLLAVLVILRLCLLMVRPGGMNTHEERSRPRTERSSRGADVRVLIAPTHEAIEQNAWLAHQIERVRGLWAAATRDRPKRDELTAALRRMEQLEADLVRRLLGIGRIARELEWADANVYGELSKALTHSDSSTRPRLARQLAVERVRVDEEEKVYRLAHKAIHQAKRIRHCLSKTVRCMHADDLKRADRWMAILLQRQQQLAALLVELARWERRLETLAGSQPATQGEPAG